MRWSRRLVPVALVAVAGLVVVGAVAVADELVDRAEPRMGADPAPISTPDPAPTLPGDRGGTPVADPAPARPSPDPAPDDAPPVPTPGDGPATDGPAAGDREIDVAAVQQRLTELGYYVDTVDGVAGPATRHATMAFQKVNGLLVDGVIGPATLAALEDPVDPTPAPGPATRLDVDLDRQVLHLVVDGVRIRTLPISSGNGEAYRTASGGTASARTPVGTFTVEREIRGIRRAPLGVLYNPKYFHHGFAIHGSPSVPATEASHGCVRVPIADSVWLFDRVPVGTPVVVHGGEHVFVPSSQAVTGSAGLTSRPGRP